MSIFLTKLWTLKKLMSLSPRWQHRTCRRATRAPRASHHCPATATPAPTKPGRPRREAITTPPSNAANDPIRMYLAQMAEIPYLLEKKKFRLQKESKSRGNDSVIILGCGFAMQSTVETLRRVHESKLPFDRTIKVSRLNASQRNRFLLVCHITWQHLIV